MLGVGRRPFRQDTATDSVHNYYEHIVFEQILRSSDRAASDSEFLADVACLALNRLPPRYVRHDVDMTFFMTPQELEDMSNSVVEAVNNAISYVQNKDSAEDGQDNEA